MVCGRSGKVVAALLALFLLGAACGDDGEEADEATTASEEDTETGGGTDETVEVSVSSIAFEGLPDTDEQELGTQAVIDAGTRISFTNESRSELHEFVAIPLPDDENRPVSELVQLPAEELNSLGEPTDVILALPGQTDAPGAVEGDGVLEEPGRYAIICAIPGGIDPQTYLDAAAEAEGGPPEVEGGGPPHFSQGMWAELTVE